MNEKPATKALYGCLLPLMYWSLLGFFAFTVFAPEPRTPPFGDSDARQFRIARVYRTGSRVAYEPLSLAAYRQDLEAMEQLDFRLPTPEVVIDYGDTDTVRVIDESDDAQLVRYVYSDPGTVVSIYRATARGIEPLSLESTGNAGPALVLFFLVFPAYLLAWLTRRLFPAGRDGADTEPG